MLPNPCKSGAGARLWGSFSKKSAVCFHCAFLIEYDNTQDNANHIHTVWRDFERDFGLDPLRAH